MMKAQRKVFITAILFLCVFSVEHGYGMGTYESGSICNVDAIKAENSDVWSYLTNVTASCGMHNANNLRAHLQLLKISPDREFRSIARRVGSEDLNRFMVIVVVGSKDPVSGVFFPESLIFDLANLELGASQPDDPLSGIGNGFFMLKMGINGNYIEGQKISNWQTSQVEYNDVDKLTLFQQEYWKNYFDAGGLIDSNDNLDW